MRFLLTILIFLICIDSYSNSFIENKGQFNREILFQTHSLENLNIAITSNAFLLDQYFIYKKGEINQSQILSKSGYVTKFEFLNASFKNYQILEKSDSYVNYFKSSDINHKQTHLHQINKILFHDIYDKIDLLLYFDQGKFRYDLILNENADPNQIQIKISGSESIENRNTSLVLTNPTGKIIHDDLKVFESSKNGSQLEASIRIKNELLRFNLPDYDKNKKLIIDPLIYATIIGGIENDVGEDAAVDRNGNIYITGYTASFNFPVTIGAYNEDINNTENSVEPDIFVTKLSPNYNHIFTTFIGGIGGDYARSCAISSDQNLLIGGYTFDSENFPVDPNSYDPFPNGAIDGFLMKFSADGDEIIWSTLIGGSSDDFILSVESASDGAPVITGYTNVETRTPFPVTIDAFQDLVEGKIDGFVCKLDPLGERLLWSGYLGGIADDFPQAVSIDKDQNILVTGSTRSVNFYTSPGALDRTYNDAENDQNVSDVFFTKINPNGSDILYSTFLGGTKKDNGYDVVSDTSGYIYLTGATESLNFPISDFAFSKEINNGNQFVDADDIFVTKINPRGDSLLYSTFIGGQSVDRAFSIGLDELENVYLTGNTNSFDFPTTLFAQDRSFNDTANYSDIFILKLNNFGDTLDYSTYFGGELADQASSIEVLREDVVLVTGTSSSTYIPTTLDAIQSSHQDSAKSDVFFLTLLMDNITDADYIICKGESIQIESGISSVDDQIISWVWEPSTGLNNDRLEFPIANPEETIQYTITATDRTAEKYISTVLVSVVPRIDTYIQGDIDVPNGLVRTYQAPFRYGSNYEWTILNGDILNGNGTNFIGVRWTDADNGYLKVVETNDFGCSDSAEIFTRYRTTWEMNIVPFGDYDLCEGDTIVYDAGDSYSNIIWNRGTEGRYDTVSTRGIYFFTALDSNNNPYRSEDAEVKFLPKPDPPKIVYQPDSLYFLCLTAGSAWQWYKDGEPIEGANERKFRTILQGDYFIEITNRFGCKNISETIELYYNNIDPKPAEVLIYPNPANNIITIKTNKIKGRAKIINSLGEELLVFEHQKESEIDISDFSNGIYFFTLENFSYKFIILR